MGSRQLSACAVQLRAYLCLVWRRNDRVPRGGPANHAATGTASRPEGMESCFRGLPRRWTGCFSAAPAVPSQCWLVRSVEGDWICGRCLTQLPCSDRAVLYLHSDIIQSMIAQSTIIITKPLSEAQQGAEEGSRRHGQGLICKLRGAMAMSSRPSAVPDPVGPVFHHKGSLHRGDSTALQMNF